jgi:glucose-1-phosphate thymidylyltransferase
MTGRIRSGGDLKGVILAGGSGSRLYPLTRVTNKHLLPVYNRPMIYYPLDTLVAAGIQDILVVTGGNSAGEFLRLLRNGKDFGLQQLNFAYQAGEAGIADALRLAEYFAAGERICVMLGDNIIEGSIRAARDEFEGQENGAMVLLKEVSDPERFGVPVLEGDRILRIEEKPARPASPYAVTGIYFYDASVFERIRRLKPSGRNEYEITDVNNSYIADGILRHHFLDGWWTDAGTFESLWRATHLVRDKERAARVVRDKERDARAASAAEVSG